MDENERELLRVAARTLVAVADHDGDRDFMLQLIRISKDAIAPAQHLMTREKNRPEASHTQGGD